MKKPFQLLSLAVISALLIACGNTPKEEVLGLPFGESHDKIVDILEKKNAHIIDVIYDNPYDMCAASSAGFDLYGLKWDTIDCLFNRGGKLSAVCLTNYQAGLDKTESEQLIADISSKYGDCEQSWEYDEFNGHKYLLCIWKMAPVVVFLSLQEDRTVLTFDHLDYIDKIDK